MKHLYQWIVIATVVNVALFLGLHFNYQYQPNKIFVGIDSSYGMKTKWSLVKNLLDKIETNSSYTQYLLATDKSVIHDWATDLSLGTTLTYGPRKLEIFEGPKYTSEISKANTKVLITNDLSAKTKFEAMGWVVYSL